MLSCIHFPKLPHLSFAGTFRQSNTWTKFAITVALPLPKLPPEISSLQSLALVLRWTWSHERDALWLYIDQALWERTHNPWVVLQNTRAERLEELAGDRKFLDQLGRFVNARESYFQTPGWFRRREDAGKLAGVAYFSMEFGRIHLRRRRTHNHARLQRAVRNLRISPAHVLRRRLHQWFDESKAITADFRHRALRHHAEGIFMLKRFFGPTITIASGRLVPVWLIGEQHVREDLGFIPSFVDWVRCIRPEPWMGRAQPIHRDVGPFTD
jgi:hypothetical protein